ncbi:hypothetical protein BV20DRAFT_350168 [Pilatotrama ljubarskyi]|nr:hypothetical protein BV20DRAFT_350168 [Pilatotrama ljubarskyi]
MHLVLDLAEALSGRSMSAPPGRAWGCRCPFETQPDVFVGKITSAWTARWSLRFTIKPSLRPLWANFSLPQAALWASPSYTRAVHGRHVRSARSFLVLSLASPGIRKCYHLRPVWPDHRQPGRTADGHFSTPVDDFLRDGPGATSLHRARGLQPHLHAPATHS